VASAASESFYLFSGAQLSSGPDGNPIRRYLKDAWRYDIQKSRWHRLADLPNAVVAAPSPAPAFGDRQILVLGGDDGANAGFQPLEDHPGFAQHSLIYSAESDTWSVLPRLQVSRVTVPIVKTDKSFILTSGELRPGVRSPEIWEMKISP
jgi:N-acetylneuraminic acid mutarotase